MNTGCWYGYWRIYSVTDKYQIDGTKIHFHPKWVNNFADFHDDWTTARHIYPIYAEVTTSAACNHRCTFCSVDAIGYPQIMLDRDRKSVV